MNWSCDLLSPHGERSQLRGTFPAIDASKQKPLLLKRPASSEAPATIANGDAIGAPGALKFSYEVDSGYEILSADMHRRGGPGYVELRLDLEGFRRGFLRITDNVDLREVPSWTPDGTQRAGTARPTLWAGYCTLDADPRVGEVMEAGELRKR